MSGSTLVVQCQQHIFPNPQARSAHPPLHTLPPSHPVPLAQHLRACACAWRAPRSACRARCCGTLESHSLPPSWFHSQRVHNLLGRVGQLHPLFPPPPPLPRTPFHCASPATRPPTPPATITTSADFSAAAASDTPEFVAAAAAAAAPPLHLNPPPITSPPRPCTPRAGLSPPPSLPHLPLFQVPARSRRSILAGAPPLRAWYRRCGGPGAAAAGLAPPLRARYSQCCRPCLARRDKNT